jgi:hypothetical protein
MDELVEEVVFVIVVPLAFAPDPEMEDPFEPTKPVRTNSTPDATIVY